MMEYTTAAPLRVFTAFSGYDSQLLALRRLREEYGDFGYTCVGWSEIEKNAIKAHNALFPEDQDKNYGDISKIEWGEVPDFDLFTYSSPCQDFSMAGRGAGGEEGSGTRSSLLWECERAIEEKRPKYLLFENVPAVSFAKFKPNFKRWLNTLSQLGYSNFPKVLNARDYGVPQRRARMFVVSILGDAAEFHFPQPFPLTRCLRDVLEEGVEDRYFIKKRSLKYFFGKRDDFLTHIYDKEGVAGTLCTKAYRRQETLIEDVRQGGLKHKDDRSNVRLLTEREGFRLMDVEERDIDIIQASGISRLAQQQLAGNSIVVAVLYHLFRKMFIERENETNELTLW